MAKSEHVFMVAQRKKFETSFRIPTTVIGSQSKQNETKQYDGWLLRGCCPHLSPLKHSIAREEATSCSQEKCAIGRSAIETSPTG